MKNAKLERFALMQRQYHRSNPWKLGPLGLFVPHTFALKQPGDLTWWADVGFILNGRRVIIWLQHPRDVYRGAIEEAAWDQLTTLKVSTCAPDFANNFIKLERQLSHEGIDLDVTCKFRITRLNWAMGCSLVAPVEVRSKADLAEVAAFARRLMFGQTSLLAEFPDYRYTRANWLAERDNIPPFLSGPADKIDITQIKDPESPRGQNIDS